MDEVKSSLMVYCHTWPGHRRALNTSHPRRLGLEACSKGRGGAGGGLGCRDVVLSWVGEFIANGRRQRVLALPRSLGFKRHYKHEKEDLSMLCFHCRPDVGAGFESMLANGRLYV